MVRSATARMLGWENSRIKVTPAEIGGGFGGKTTIYLEPLAVKLSEKAKRPVKLVMSRSEVFQATGPTPATKFRVKLGVRKDGKITAGQSPVCLRERGLSRVMGAGGRHVRLHSLQYPQFQDRRIRRGGQQTRQYGLPRALVSYGRLCHRFYPG